ncbi:Fur-regulated basic protein FbpA [Aneurinibacillus sp. Ricciae_BoGa-3]|nr:Fur-regulated basic protein FbpA [Aneurinibacillus sp. Ricciae_BoGa-3]WCK55859.1 Fur-regulated basic protein FbpA [Aneurinibacillus sp. Ricciae_BoGa-3]
MNPYVEELLKLGIYKIGERQLYECSEEEVKRVLIDASESHENFI